MAPVMVRQLRRAHFWRRTAMAVKNPYDLTSPTFLADPYAVYAQLRRELPVCWDERLGFWLVSRYADVFAALRDHRLSSAQLAEGVGRAPGGGRGGGRA